MHSVNKKFAAARLLKTTRPPDASEKRVVREAAAARCGILQAKVRRLKGP
jgi:hypothetical protein